MFYTTIALVIIGQVFGIDPLQQLTSASADFSQRLYQKVALSMSSVVYSPYSIHSCLTMTSLGARGDTATEMRNTLGVTSLGDTLRQTYRTLIRQIQSVSDVKLLFANAIFVNPRYRIVPKFILDVDNYYRAKADNINFTTNGGPETPINEYIAYKTNNNIMNAVPKDTIKKCTVMLLVNTIYFKGSWQQGFSKEKTDDQDFYLEPGIKAFQVKMMHDERYIKIKRDDTNGFDVAELPYKGGRFSLYIVLPQAVDGITNLEKSLSDAQNVQKLFSGLELVKVELAIPKFKTESSISMKPVLQSMGMVGAFEFEMADFTGISQVEKGNIFINQVLHKAVFEVDETGAIATETTEINEKHVELQTNDSVSSLLEDLVFMAAYEAFVADHPFVYFLRNNQNGQIIFQGKFAG